MEAWQKYWIDGMSLLEKEAMRFCVAKHAKSAHTRKYTGDEYAVHPAGVVSILREIGSDSALLAAAWLHDIKDCNVSSVEVEYNFGSDVARLVDEVSEIATPLDGNRKKRKALECLHLAKASYRGKTLKLADVIDNMKTIVARDPNFAMVYVPEKWEELQSLRGGHPKLWDRAFQCIGCAASELGIVLNPSFIQI